MNVSKLFDRNASSNAPARTAPVAPARHVHRERDFGVGYGNSSGYASSRRYTNDWAQPRFRFA
ncbi:MAG: hypothetical protein HOQ32_06055 [Lysobacter sp.]|nr:hypothetical protein [Lysobacter sp.]